MNEVQDIQVAKAFVTVFNFIILTGAALMFAWHFSRIKKRIYHSFEWWSEVMACMVYGSAINAEIPACWLRLRSFYTPNFILDYTHMVLTTWDRWGHVLLYIILIAYTVMQSRGRVPEYIKNTLS